MSEHRGASSAPWRGQQSRMLRGVAMSTVSMLRHPSHGFVGQQILNVCFSEWDSFDDRLPFAGYYVTLFVGSNSLGIRAPLALRGYVSRSFSSPPRSMAAKRSRVPARRALVRGAFRDFPATLGR